MIRIAISEAAFEALERSRSAALAKKTKPTNAAKN
jgi:hypothetical protein